MEILRNACTWWLNSKLGHDRKQDSAGWKGIPVYDCSREEAVFIIVGRGRDLFLFEFLAVNGIPSKRCQLTCTHFIQYKKQTIVLIKKQVGMTKKP